MPTPPQYTISEYHNTDEIDTRLKDLVKQPLRPIRCDRMQTFLNYFATKCARSKALTDEAKPYIPGGVQHNLAFNFPFPLAVEKASGAYLWDVDGNRYTAIATSTFCRQAAPPSSAAITRLCVRRSLSCCKTRAGDGPVPRIRIEIGAVDSSLYAVDRDVPHVGLRHRKRDGGNSDVWCQIFADVLNCEVRQVKDPIQANARGAAFIAAAGLGEIVFTDVPGLVHFNRVYEPAPQHRQLYHDRYQVYVEIYRQMRGIYRKLNRQD